MPVHRSGVPQRVRRALRQALPGDPSGGGLQQAHGGMRVLPQEDLLQGRDRAHERLPELPRALPERLQRDRDPARRGASLIQNHYIHRCITINRYMWKGVCLASIPGKCSIIFGCVWWIKLLFCVDRAHRMVRAFDVIGVRST